MSRSPVQPFPTVQTLPPLPTLSSLPPRELVRVVREDRVDAPGVEELRHLVPGAGIGGLLVRAHRPDGDGETEGVGAGHEIGMRGDQLLLRRDSLGEGREVLQLRVDTERRRGMAEVMSRADYDARVGDG